MAPRFAVPTVVAQGEAILKSQMRRHLSAAAIDSLNPNGSVTFRFARESDREFLPAGSILNDFAVVSLLALSSESAEPLTIAEVILSMRRDVPFEHVMWHRRD